LESAEHLFGTTGADKRYSVCSTMWCNTWVSTEIFYF